MSWEDISDVLTEEGVKKLQTGQVLMFDYEGSRTELRVMRITAKGRVWCKRVVTHAPNEVIVTENGKSRRLG